MKLSRKTRPPKEERHKGGHKKLKAVIVAIVILLVLFVALIGFITDFLWFKELDYVGVFFTKLFTNPGKAHIIRANAAMGRSTRPPGRQREGAAG